MSENKILTQCFDKEELSDKKRPDTVRRLLFNEPLLHSLKIQLMHPNSLVHKQTNSGVFPLSDVEWAALMGILC